MATKQTWKINGKTYDREQLRELRAKGLNPLKDDIEMKMSNANIKEEIKKPKIEKIERPKKVEKVGEEVKTAQTNNEEEEDITDDNSGPGVKEPKEEKKPKKIKIKKSIKK